MSTSNFVENDQDGRLPKHGTALLNRELLRSLKPLNYGDHAVESAEAYLTRARALLPNFPDSVLTQWLHRHYTDAVSNYGWLGFEALGFSAEDWALSDVVGQIASFVGDQDDSILHWARCYRDRLVAEDNWLVQSMKQLGTWPEPVMVLRNSVGFALPNGLRLGAPFHLVEGYHRLGFLTAMTEDAAVVVVPKHSLWVLDADPAAISSEWPNV